MDQPQGIFYDIRAAVEITRQAVGAPRDELRCPVERVLDLERIAREESLYSLAWEQFEDPFVQRIVELAADGASGKNILWKATLRLNHDSQISVRGLHMLQKISRMETVIGPLLVLAVTWMLANVLSATLSLTAAGTLGTVLMLSTGPLLAGALVLGGASLSHHFLKRVTNHQKQILEGRRLMLIGVVGIADHVDMQRLVGAMRDLQWNVNERPRRPMTNTRSSRRETARMIREVQEQLDRCAA